MVELPEKKDEPPPGTGSRWLAAIKSSRDSNREPDVYLRPDGTESRWQNLRKSMAKSAKSAKESQESSQEAAYRTNTFAR